MTGDGTGAVSAGVLGLLAATLAAALWAVATVLYRRVGRVLPPVRMNLLKGAAATLLLAVVVAWQWGQGGNPLELAPGLMALLALSGVIGIGCGDTCFFAALNRLGARRTLLMFMLAPVLTAALGWLLLDEVLSALQVAGIAVTCCGVGWVIAERTPARGDGYVDLAGLAFALGAAACQAVGSLISRHVFEQSGYGAAPSALVRVVTGTAVLVLLLPLDRVLRDPGGPAGDHPSPPGRAATWTMLGTAMFLGTFLGIWLQQTAFKLSLQVGVAATLLSTSPLFVLPLAAATGDRISPRAVVGAAVGVLGVAVLLGALG